MAIGVKKTADKILRRTGRHALRKRHEDHFIAAERLAVPGTVLTDKGTALIACRKQLAVIKSQAQRSRVRTQRVVGRDRLGDQVRPRRFYARIDMLAVITVGPAIECTILDR